VARVSSADVIYFTGHDPAPGKNGAPGVFSIPATGGTVTTIAEGPPFVDPSGIAVGSNGILYIADTSAIPAPGAQGASIIKVDTNNGNAATLFSTSMVVGYPAGVALSLDGTTLYVSSLAPGTSPGLLTDQIAVIDVATMGMETAITMNINTFTETAGMHRAKSVDVFAWADSSAGVFTVR
jgi:sugar lactone lactonase YvrE